MKFKMALSFPSSELRRYTSFDKEIYSSIPKEVLNKIHTTFDTRGHRASFLILMVWNRFLPYEIY